MDTSNIPEYDVAVSFAGENRQLAEDISDGLSRKGLKIFYDKYEEATLWGKDLYVHLVEVYRDKSKYCLVIISEAYSKKLWTNHERRAAQSRAFRENQEYILPLKLDDTSVDGILDTTGYIDYRKKSTEEVVDLIFEKVKQYNKAKRIKFEIVHASEVFKEIKMPNGLPPLTDRQLTTQCPSCQKTQNLGEATVSLLNEETIYTCKNGCQPIAVIGRPGLVPWDGRGYRLGMYVIRSPKDIFIEIHPGKPKVVLSGGTAALMKKRPKE